MNNGGDAAEQVVRLSLEGFEVAAKLTGSAAKNVALLLVSVLKQEQQTKHITEDGGADAAKPHAEATAEGERPN